jgi:lipopolysaccharide transport system permease protein
MTDTPLNQSVLVIEAGRAERHYWRDLWRYRELFLFLAWRDIIVRYKQTNFGVAWALARPFLTMLLFTLVFSKLAGLPSDGVPYSMLVLSALLPWQFFTGAFSSASESLVSNAAMISKVYFPRLLFPISAMVVSFVDFLIASLIMIGLMVWYGFAPDLRMLTLPLFILVALVTSMAVGLWMAALNVKHRDIGIIIPVAVQFGMYVSPVVYSSSLVPDKWRLLYFMNPMAGVIEGFRWAILGGNSRIYLPGFLLSIVMVIVILVSGIAYFRKTEKSFVDNI